MVIYRAREPQEVDFLLARAFSEQDVEACADLYHPDASVVRIDYFGDVAKGAQGIREVMADYVGLAPTMDVTVHHVTRAGDHALVRSQWKIRGTYRDGCRWRRPGVCRVGSTGERFGGLQVPEVARLRPCPRSPGGRHIEDRGKSEARHSSPGGQSGVTFDPAAVQHAYEAIAGDYETKFTDELEHNEFDRAIVDAAIASVPRGEIVLDVGCGPAQVSRRVLAGDARAVGIDLTPAMLAIARRQVPFLPLTCGDVLALPYRQGVAAAAIAWYSLHNLPRPLMRVALTELRRVLHPGGVVVIATHAGEGEEAIEQARGDRSETVTITYYEADELTALAAEHGLTPTELRERPPLDHEHQVRKLYLTATAS